ncbi:MAG: DNA repair protein RecO [Halothiobacillaceae bacterium]
MARGIAGGGYVLHTRPWKESSLLLELFTPDQGRIGAIMRAARRVGGRHAVRPQPFQFYSWTLGGRGELKNLSGLELAGRGRQMGMRPLVTGLYFNELLVRALSREAPTPGLFDAYDLSLSALAELGEVDLHALARRFELALIDELGVSPPWDVTVTGEPVDPEGRYRVDPEAGVLPATGLEGTLTGGDLLTLARGQPEHAGDRRAVRLLLARLLAPHIGPGPLRSRELWPGNSGPSGSASPLNVK